MVKPLNWREIGILAQWANDRLAGSVLERVVVPVRPEFLGGYLRAEWAFRWNHPQHDSCLILSLRPQATMFYCLNGKGPNASTQATHSPFELALNKHLQGSKLISIRAVPMERVVHFEFAPDKSSPALGIAWHLIPAAPDAFLYELKTGQVICGHRKAQTQERYHLPKGRNAPSSPPIRLELKDTETYSQAVESELNQEALAVRKQRLEKLLRDNLRHLVKKQEQFQIALRSVNQESHWRQFGDLMKSHLYDLPPLTEAGTRIFKEKDGKSIVVPCQKELSPPDQMQKFYQLGKRQERKLQESQERLDHLGVALARISARFDELRSLATQDTATSFLVFQKLESEFANPSLFKQKKPSKAEPSLGRVFQSSESWKILVGRNREENMMLTFRVGRGNDIWMHVKGRPGAHVIIPVASGKTAPLETLLDAAQLAIYYSGGEHWGKTEVDYTFKKHVKRIKQSTEVSYTHNKTLVVENNPQRLQKLLSQEKFI